MKNTKFQELSEYKYKGLKNVRVYIERKKYNVPSYIEEQMCDINVALNIEQYNSESLLGEDYSITRHLFDATYINQNLREVQGKVLTLLEATIQNELQLKAIKDITNNLFRDKQNEISGLAHCDWQE